MTKTVRLGAGSGFWGDAADPAFELLEKGKLDYLCFDFLAELTMAILQRQKHRDPNAGYVTDAVSIVTEMITRAKTTGTKLVTNGGGVNPSAAGAQIIEAARAQGLHDLKVGVVEGDDLMGRLDEILQSGEPLAHMETGATGLAELRNRIVCANVYTDGGGVRDALAQGADVVVTGRVSDNGLYAGAAMHAFGWTHSDADVDKLAAIISLGHIVECAAACTGGMSSRFAQMPNMGKVGFPIIELDANGDAVITKVEGSGGRVDDLTVKEHLVYEIADPREYLMPDGVADFTSLRIEDLGNDRVAVTGARGAPPPDKLKLVVGYQDGWIGEGLAFFPWPDAYSRAEKAKQTMLERFDRLGLKSDEIQFDFVGLNMLHGPGAPVIDPEAANRMPEIGLRCAVRTRSREEAEKVRRAASNLWIFGPGGTSFGAPMKPRPVVSLWPTLVPRAWVQQQVTILSV